MKSFYSLILLALISVSSHAQSKPSYEFKSRFENSSSVSYHGQALRNLQVQDIAISLMQFERGTFFGSKEEAQEAIWSFVNYLDENPSIAQFSINKESEILLTAIDSQNRKTPWAEGYTYGDIQTGVQILNKLAGVDNPLTHGELLGWDLKKKSTPKDLLEMFANRIAEHSSKRELLVVKNLSGKTETVRAAYVDESGLDYRQLIQKFLYGSLIFSQISEDYLSDKDGSKNGLKADNSKPQKSDVNYTTLEHHWDEAFGYFGAARDFLNYSSDQLAKGQSVDTNNDNKISLKSEYNIGLARVAAKREATTGIPLATQIFKNFYDGRRLISEAKAGYLDQIKKISIAIINDLERVFASSSIHYINETLKIMSAINSEKYSFAEHAKYWSEMKGFALAMQFNPQSIISKNDFVQFHSLVGDKPVLAKAGKDALDKYVKDLIAARTLLQKIYGFKNVQNW